jgi:ankyrin repeat protein
MQHHGLFQPKEVQFYPWDQVENKQLRDNLYYAYQAMNHVRNFVKFDSSSTQPTLRDKDQIDFLWEKINMARKEILSFLDAFKLFVLSSSNDEPSLIHMRITVMKIKKYHVENCSGLSEFAIIFLTKMNVRAELISLIDSDHTIVFIDRNPGDINNIDSFGESCVVLDVLNNQIYPASMIYKTLHCYKFDETKDNPHCLTPFTSQNKFTSTGFIRPFIDPNHNRITINKFFNKLNLIQSCLGNHLGHNHHVSQEIEKLFNSYRKEVSALLEKNLVTKKTNFDIERTLRKILKSINEKISFYIKEDIVKDSEHFMICMIIEMFKLYSDPKKYFENLIMIQPLFLKLFDYIQTSDNSFISDIKNQFQDKNLVQNLLIFALDYVKNNEACILLKILGGAHNEPSIKCSSLRWAMEANNKEVILALSQIELMTKKTINGVLPLHFAIQNYPTIALFILNQPHPSDALALLLDAQKYKGKTALYYAIQCGHIKLVKKIVSLGAKTNITTIEKKSILHLAIELEDQEKIIDYILRINPKLINYQDFNGYSALHMACEIGDIKIVEALLNQGADPNLTLYMEKTNPLHLAVMADHTAIVDCLLNHSPHLINSQNAEGYSALHLAITNGNDLLVSQLLKRDADPELKTLSGCTPLNLIKTINQPILVQRKISKHINHALQKKERQLTYEQTDTFQLKKHKF